MLDPLKLELQRIVEHLRGCWEPNSDPLQEQQSLLTSDHF